MKGSNDDQICFYEKVHSEIHWCNGLTNCNTYLIVAHMVGPSPLTMDAKLATSLSTGTTRCSISQPPAAVRFVQTWR